MDVFGRLLSVSTVAFDGHRLDTALDMLAELGMTVVEPAFIRGYMAFTEEDFAEPGPLRRALLARGLNAPAVSAHFDLSHPDAASMLDRRIGFAAELGAGILITNAGPAVAGDTILRTIDGALRSLDREGIVLALENPGHGTGDLIGTGQEGAALIARLGHDRVGLNYDVGNVFTYSGGRISPPSDLPHALPHVRHMHLKDVADDGAGGWRFCALGAGLIDWAGIARVVGRADIPCGLELPLRLRRPGRGDPERADRPADGETVRAALKQSREHWHAATAAARVEP